MTKTDMQQEISIIKEMIDKSRNQFVQSGLLFIIPGIMIVFTLLLVHFLHQTEYHTFAQPLMIAGISAVIVTSIFIGVREGLRDKVQTYAKYVFSQVWLACGAAIAIVVFILPLSGEVPSQAAVILTFPILSIAIYLTGVIFKINLIRWSSLAWWLGMILMAVTENTYNPWLISLIFIFGYILPGILLNRQYKKQEAQNAA